MVKVFNPPSFNVKLAFKPKRNNSSIKNSIVSRKCFAVVKLIEGEFKAVINIDKKRIYLKEGDKLSNEQLILPFTDKSLELRNKTHVWLKYKDKYGHNICVIRESKLANISPGLSIQYDALKDNLLISGHIIRKDGKLYFNYEDLIASNYLSNSAKLSIANEDETKPLFNK